MNVRAKEEKVGLFTVHLELGEETRATLATLARTSAIRIELGRETRAMIERLLVPSEEGNGGRAVGRLVENGAKALRSD